MRTFLALFCGAFLASCSQPKIDTVAEGEKLMQISRDWSKAAATGNIDSILSYWADDAIVLEPGQKTLKGKVEIRAMLEGTSKIPGFSISWEPQSVSVSSSGDMAYLVERSQVTVNDSLGESSNTIQQSRYDLEKRRRWKVEKCGGYVECGVIGNDSDFSIANNLLYLQGSITA